MPAKPKRQHRPAEPARLEASAMHSGLAWRSLGSRHREAIGSGVAAFLGGVIRTIENRPAGTPAGAAALIATDEARMLGATPRRVFGEM